MTGIAAGSGALTGVAFGWWGVVAVAAAAVVLLIVSERDRFVVAACVVAVVGSCLGAVRAVDRGNPSPGIGEPGAPGLASVAAAPVETGQRQYFVAEMASEDERDEGGFRVCVTAGAFPEVRLGDVVRLRGDFRDARDAAGGHRAAMTSRGCGASLYATSLLIAESTPSPMRVLADVRSRIGATLRSAAPGDAGVLLSGLVTGDDAGFSPERQEAFIRTGTTHLTAVSGSNLALVAGILAAVGTATVGRHRAAWQSATIGAVWAYALISGGAAPAIRAAIVVTAAILAFRFGRRPDFPTLILLAAGAMALIDPSQVDSLGFRLSVAASLALAFVVPPLVSRGPGAGLASVLVATAAAQIATLPFLLAVFGTVSLTSVPANVAAAPLVAVAMPLAALAGLAGVVWWPLGETISAPATLAVNGLLAVVDLFGAPDAYVSVGVPPLGAAGIVAVTGGALLLALTGGATRRGAWLGMSELDSARGSTLAECEILPPAAALVVAGEDPSHALATHLDDPKQNPAGQKDGDQVTDERNGAKTFP